MVAFGSTNPARIFGLYPRKGTIAAGADADLVIYDPTATGTRGAKTHHSRCDRSIFEGFKVKGKPTRVIVNGRVQYEDGKLEVERGAGRFIQRVAARPGTHAPAGAIATQAARAK
jgi:dihydropyrimidinase